MRKPLTALVAAATIAGTLAAGTTDASAQWRRGGWGWGPGLAAGIIGGAIIAGALSRPYYGYGYGYGYGDAYYAPAYAYAPAPVYDYYAPAPVYYSYYAAPRPYLYGCWRWRFGARYRVC